MGKIHDLLNSIGENVRTGNVPLDDFIIYKVGQLPIDPIGDPAS